MMYNVVFSFSTEDPENALSKDSLEKWAKDINDAMAAHVIGYEGWSVEMLVEGWRVEDDS